MAQPPPVQLHCPLPRSSTQAAMPAHRRCWYPAADLQPLCPVQCACALLTRPTAPCSKSSAGDIIDAMRHLPALSVAATMAAGLINIVSCWLPQMVRAGRLPLEARNLMLAHQLVRILLLEAGGWPQRHLSTMTPAGAVGKTLSSAPPWQTSQAVSG